ncbi:hypothetical protein P692DRAFT_20135618 [Suillus brevipes Sb2]|nr:hypothetical protein P692DRAFT_20135618 [Suillus brevipes Sb2]
MKLRVCFKCNFFSYFHSLSITCHLLLVQLVLTLRQRSPSNRSVLSVSTAAAPFARLIITFVHVNQIHHILTNKLCPQTSGETCVSDQNL